MKTIRTGFAVITFLLAAFPGAAQDALMSDLERLSAKQACEDLLINYGYYLDEGDLEATIALFSDDASFITGGGEAKGKDAIRQVLQRAIERRAGTTLVSQHVISNVSVEFSDRDHGHIRAYEMLFSYDPAEPEATVALRPSLIGSLDDACVRTPEGWRYQRRSLTAFRPGG